MYFRLSHIFIFFSSFLLFNCQSDLETHTYRFYGDSHVKNWDLDFYFGNYKTDNCGINGNVIRGLFAKHNFEPSHDIAVVQIGFNDIEALTKNNSLSAVKDSLRIRYSDLNKNLSSGFSKVFYLSLIPYVDCDDIILSNARSLANEMLDSLATLNSNVLFLSITDEIENESNCLNPAFSYDQVHLNEIGYQSISRAVNNAF